MTPDPAQSEMRVETSGDLDLVHASKVTDWAPNPEQLYWASELRNILLKALEELRPL